MLFVPVIPKSVLSTGTPSGVKIPQGSLIEVGVLDMVLMDQEGQYVTPLSMRYSVLAVDSTGQEHRIGLDNLTALTPRTGVHSPYFTVGESWPTGRYRLKWEYSLGGTEHSTVRNVDFEVVSSGLYDSRWVGLGLYNIRATVEVVD